MHPSTRSSPNRDDDESDNLAPFNAYPNAYGVKPGHDVGPAMTWAGHDVGDESR